MALYGGHGMEAIMLYIILAISLVAGAIIAGE